MTERHSDTKSQATPRTDEFYGDRKDGVYRNVIVEKAVEHSRQLERELAEAKAARPSIEAQRETRRVYRTSAEYAEYLKARFANTLGISFKWQDKRWRYEYTDFDHAGDFDLLIGEAPPSATGAQMTQEQVLALINMPQPNYSQEQHNYLMMLLEKANRHSAAGSEPKEGKDAT